MIHANPEISKQLALENLEELETLEDLENSEDSLDLSLEELFALAGDRVDKNSEEHLNYFTNRVEVAKLDDLTVPNCKIILKNTFERYANCFLVEVERNTFYSADGIPNSAPNWLLMRRSPFLFRDVLITPQNNFALLFDSEKSSVYKSIPHSSQFGVISEGSYFISKREFKGMVVRSELFYVPLISEKFHC